MIGFLLFIGGFIFCLVGLWILLLADKINLSNRKRLIFGLGSLYLGALFFLILFTVLY